VDKLEANSCQKGEAGERTGTRTGAVDLLDAGEVAVAGLVDAHLRPRLEHPQQPRHQPLRHRRFRLCPDPARWNRSRLPPLRRLLLAGTGRHRPRRLRWPPACVSV
jgi:hypothetical protein